MPAFKITLFGLFSILISLALGSKCPQDAISKLVVCYYKGETSLAELNICNCTHLVFTSGVKRAENNSMIASEDTIKLLEVIKEKKSNLSALFTFETKPEETSAILKSGNRSEEHVNGIVEFLQDTQFDGVELNLKFSSDDGLSKESYASFVKRLSKTLSSQHRRVKREGYDVFEKVQDDVTTASYTTQTPKNSTSKTQSIKEEGKKSKENNRKIREDTESSEEDGGNDDDEKNVDYATLEEAINAEFSEEKPENQITLADDEEDIFEEKKFLVFVRLPIKPEIVAKKYDLKSLSRYADILTVPTHDIVNSSEEDVTYHPSRLMGLSDILNTDSILDFLTGMGAPKSKMVISLPATVLKFQLKDENKNTPRSPSRSKPQVIDQSQLCSLFSKSNWTVERDDDLTAPYAFSGKTWLAFEDEISVNIKGKYILLRELAGGAIYPIDADVNDGLCTNHTGSGGYLSGILHKNFESLGRKPRALVLESLQEEIHDNAYTSIEAGVKLSEYRIVRVVDHSGAVHVIRKNTKTQFECSRQGYFSHPLGCNKFYRCVKFDQYSDEFTVFEYDCPAGLAFDERWEVCVWPGSLPHGAPCTGSSEIAPVPRSHYQCPNHEGYFADPENCRWFFACLDHARDGITPLTAYEFRCPFGLVFSEEKLACDWPWLVGACGNRGAAGYLQVNTAGQSQAFHSATFINGGNLEASLGQYGNTEQESAFIGFGKKFGSGLKGGSAYAAQGSYQGAQSAGFGYIANQYDDQNDRAAFAAFPEYEISGGRSFNKGGVVLDQHVAGISGVAAGGAVGGFGATNVGSSGSFGSGAGYHQEIGQFSTVESTPNIKLQNLEPALEISSGGQASFQSSVSTPRPIAVSIPSVQINSEQHSGFAEHSTVAPTTPHTLLFKETPRTDNIQLTGKTISASQGLTVNHPSFSVGVQSVTPTAATHTFGETITGLGASSHLSTPSVSFVSSPKIEIHRFGQNAGNRISVNQDSVTSGIPVVSGSGSFKYSSGDKTEAVSVSVPVVTPKAGAGKFEYTASGLDVGFSGTSAPTESSFGGYSQFNHKFTDQKAFGKSAVSVEIPVVTPKPGIETFEYTASGLGVGISGSAVPTESSFEGYSQFNHKITDQKVQKFGQSSVSLGGPAVYNEAQTHGSVNAGLEQTGFSYGAPIATATPSVYSNGAKIGSESHLSVVSSNPTVAPVVHSTIDEKVSNELRFNSPQTYSVPAVTPKTEFHTFSKFASSGEINTNAVSNTIPVGTQKPDFQVFSGSGFKVQGLADKAQGTVSYEVPLVTPQPNSFKFYQQHATGVGVTPIVPFEVSTGVKHNFDQTEVLKEFSPAIAPHTFETSSIHGKGIVQEKTSYSVPVAPSGLNTEVHQSGGVSHTFVTPQPEIKYSQGSGFGQRYSYSSSFKQSGDQFGTVQPFAAVSSTQKPDIFVSKVEQSKILSGVAIEQQPIVSVGTISSGSVEQSFSTPSPVQNHLPEGPLIKFKSSYVQPQPVAVTTSAPIVSITPSTSITYESHQPTPTTFSTFGKSFIHGQQKVNLETSGPGLQQTIVSGPGSTIFNEKSYHQEIKSYSPVSQITTAIPRPFDQGIRTGFEAKSGFLQQGQSYLPPVTPKTEIFGSVFNQNSHVPTGNTERSQILLQKERPKLIVNHSYDFFKPKSFEEKGTKFIQVETPAPEYQYPAVSITKPREQLVELEITKSVEINPNDIPQSAVGDQSPRPIVIQQQPVHLLSEKTFPAKQVIQPFYKQQEKEIVHTQINNIPESGYVYQQQLKSPIIVEQKEYQLPVVTQTPPTVSFSTVKTIQQPVVYSEGHDAVAPALPVFEPSRVPYTTQITEAKFGANLPSAKRVFVQKQENQQPVEVVSSKVNLLLPTVTELPQHTSSQAEELSVQTHRNFHSQKIKFGSSPVQNVFIQPEIHSTLKPSIFESGHYFQFNRAQNLSTGTGSEVRYAINPNIAIPDPPREYILAQNAFTTAVPEVVTTGGQFQSTGSFKSGFKATTYLPPQVPSRKKSSKTTVISVGNVDDDEGDVSQIIDKYSGRFGEVINEKTDKFVTKVIKGDGRGRIQLDRQGSSTVQYEVSSTSRPKSRGRQYHGGITSGVQATNKYEEYEIEGDNQRSFAGNENSDTSKTTIDLKNLKLEKDKKTVIVVSQVSDANPVLIGKLAGQCSCQSNMLELRGKGKKTKGSLRRKNKIPQQPTITNEYLPPYEAERANSGVEILTGGEVSTAAPDTVLIDGSKTLAHGVSFQPEQNYVSSSTTAHPEIVSSTLLSSLGPDGVISITPKAVYSEERLSRKKQFRGRTRYLAPVSLISEDGSSVPLFSPVPASEIASTLDYSALRGDESRTQNEIDGGSAKVLAGAAFDRYGPGGWRSFDETLQGSIDCKRPGLFRHPKYCNKFYACNYDPWKERYTLHVFNCPIHLTYDSSISACNWPVRGPACADDNLLV